MVGAGPGAAGAAPAPPVDTAPGCFVVSLDSAGTGMMIVEYIVCLWSEA